MRPLHEDRREGVKICSLGSYSRHSRSVRTRSDIYFVGNGYTTEMNSAYRFSALIFRNALINLFLFIFGKRSRRSKFGGGAFCIRSVRTRGIAAVRTATFRCITFRNRALTLYQVRLADSAYDYLCHFDQVSNANARRNLALLIAFSSSGQTPLYASHINIACNFIPLPLLFAQKPRFCASAKALHFFRRLSRNDKDGYNIFHKIQPPRGRLCDRAAALKQLLI